MAKSDFWKKFWDTARVISLYLLVPAACMLVGALFFYLLDVEPERFDSRTEALIISCTDETKRNKAERENGGPIIDFLVEAEYQVDGVTYLCKEHWGSRKQVGSTEVILYNSDNPSDSTLNKDPVGGKKRVGHLAAGSGMVLLLCVTVLAVHRSRRKQSIVGKESAGTELG